MSLNHLIKRQSRTPVTVTRQILFSLVGVNMLVTVLFSAAFYVKQKKTLIADMDSTLRAVVTLARETLPTDYHDRITGASSVSNSEFLKIVDRNNRLCVALGLEYIWSLMEVDGRIVFTTSTSPDKVSDNRNHAVFFELHSNPEFYIPIFESMVPTYRNCYDKWGQIRACLIPYTDVHGRKYLFGSSYRLTEVDRQLRLILWRVTGIGLTLFAVSMAIGFWVTRRITRPIDQLTSTIQGIVAGQRDLVAEERGSREQVILARQFNLMNRALQEKISELEMAREQLVEIHSLERKQTGEELVLSEQRYRGLLNFAVDGILVGSHEGIISEANERMCLLFGLEKNELIGKRITEMPFTPESVQKTPFRFDLLHKGDMVVSERTIRRSDGSEIVVEMHTKMMADGTYQSIYHDITERRQSQEKLLMSEQRYRDILNFAVDGILICCNEGIIIEANERMLELCGLELSKLVGHSIFEMPFTPESVLAKPLRIDLVEKGETVVSERTVRRSDGSEVVVEMHTKKMPDGNHQSIWYDITQRKQTEALLIETRRLLDETQRIARVGGWVIDFNTGNAAWTEEVYRIYGVGPDFNINDRDLVFSFYAPEQAPILMRAVNEGLAQGEPFDLECGFIRADGKHIWVRVIGQPTLVDGRIVKVNGCLMDITERKQAEAALQLKQAELTRQNEVMAALLQNLTVGVFMVEAPSGKPLVANAAACRLLGRGILPDADAHNLDEIYEAYKGAVRTSRYPVDEMPIMLGMKGVSAHVDDLVIKRPDGQEVQLEIYGVPVKNEQGCVWASLVSFVDITERERMGQVLRESQERYRQLFEMESDAIFLVDSEAGQILDVNLAAQTLYGYSREDLLSKRNVDLSAEPEQTRQHTQNAEENPAPLIRIALRKHRKSDGSVFPVEITARAFTLNGRSVHIAAIRDITQRVKAQELMASWNVALEKRVVERTAEVERRTGQLHRLTGRLIRAEEDERKRISDVLHEDLQQTLVAARMTLGIVIESARRVTAVDSLQKVDGMLSQSIRLTRNLVQEIAVPAVMEGDLPVAIRWIAQQMQDRFGLTVELAVGDGLPPVSENVYLCLYRAVQELLFNVVKHSRAQHATVSVGMCEGDLVRVAVTDRGAGFSTVALAQEGKKDVGIGLHSIRERIEGLGGHIEIVSAEGEGTRVVLTVPAHNGSPEAGLPLTGLFASVNHEG